MNRLKILKKLHVITMKIYHSLKGGKKEQCSLYIEIPLKIPVAACLYVGNCLSTWDVWEALTDPAELEGVLGGCFSLS